MREYRLPALAGAAAGGAAAGVDVSIRSMTIVWRHYPEGGGELVLALALADWSDDRGRGIYPAVPAAARKARLSHRQVQRLLRRMESAGYLDAAGETEYGTRRYRLRLDQIEALPVVYGRRAEDDEADVTPGDKMSSGVAGRKKSAPNVQMNDTMSLAAARLSPNTCTPVTSFTPPSSPPGGGGLVWPAQLASGARAACAAELQRAPLELRAVIIRELGYRLGRQDLASLRQPQQWIRALAHAAAVGTLVQYAPAAPLSPEQRAAVEDDYDRRLAESRARGARELAALVARSTTPDHHE